MPNEDYTTFTEANLSEFIQVSRRYHELKNRLYGWRYPTQPSEAFGDVAYVERVAKLAGVGVDYECAPNGDVWCRCEVDGVEFCAVRERASR